MLRTDESPRPMPSTARPPDSAWTEAIAPATTDGCRVTALVALVVSLIRDVAVAADAQRAERVAIISLRIGDGEAIPAVALDHCGVVTDAPWNWEDPEIELARQGRQLPAVVPAGVAHEQRRVVVVHARLDHFAQEHVVVALLQHADDAALPVRRRLP